MAITKKTLQIEIRYRYHGINWYTCKPKNSKIICIPIVPYICH